jgi:serine/threonine protein kinase
MRFKAGDSLQSYQILDSLGEGGMGEVYLARDVLLERNVAIKCLNPLLTTDREFSQRFIREARIQAQLTHSHIVGLYAFFEESGFYYMVMEYAPGITLRQLIDRTGPIPEKRTLAIFRQIMAALEYAHAKGIIHRDVKPSNIMIDTEHVDAVKVMDFGIARLMNDVHSTQTGTRLGTVSYMSPEQVRAEKEIDQSSDIYSAGVILYEMLSGRLPFPEGASDYTIQHQIVTEPIPDPRDVYPYISDGTVQLMRHLTQKDRDLRPSSVKEALAFKPVAVTGATTVGTGSGPVEKAAEPNLEFSRPPVQQRRKPNAFIILLIIVGAALLSLYAFRAIMDSRAEENSADSVDVMEKIYEPAPRYQEVKPEPPEDTMEELPEEDIVPETPAPQPDSLGA